MPINKFGSSLDKSRSAGSASIMDYYKWNGLLRNYVRDNALCRSSADFDAKSLKIRCVAQPEADTDAVNKLYVENIITTLVQKHEEFKKNLMKQDINIHILQERVINLEQLVQQLSNK